MAEILLTTLNAKYAHASLGLRYLHANLGELASRAAIREFVIQDRPVDVAEALLAESPRIIGIGVYVWNARESLELVRTLVAVAPEVRIVVGGPEVSHEVDEQDITKLAHHVVVGEGELAFAELCRRILAGEEPAEHVLSGGLPSLGELASPYGLYTSDDIGHRTIYVEASRGCPYTCEFCLSSLDLAVRQFPLETFLDDMQGLIDRGARQFKFIDRTFNLKPRISVAIMEFFLERMELGLFVHFELVPDRLPSALREVIARFPAGSLQFEIGIQTFDPDTSERISRKQDLDKVEDNLRFLAQQTGVHVHADLIVGLPGESMASFATGFDRLYRMGPHEIQVGILKRLRGAPIARHTECFAMVYSESPPYEVLQTSELSFAELARMKRFARAWDLVANRGNFRETTPLLCAGDSPFGSFFEFSDWLFARVGAFKGVALARLSELCLEFLTDVRGLSRLEVGAAVAADYGRSGRRMPGFLLELAEAPVRARLPAGANKAVPKRQARHLD